ncbi:transcriptional regulator [Candidatus Saccharibacteria bacterium]|nr:transcriptional regulator [Candidatus Saccharibacteria bacterium]
MIEQLFGSKTRVKLLQLFYSNPNRSFYVREITRKIDEQINSVRRELANLLSIGIITSDANNNRLYYEINQTYEHYPALSQIFGSVASSEPSKKATKSTGKSPKVDVEREHPLAKAVRATGRVDLAILTGQFTRDEQSGVDVLIVGDINQTKLGRFIAELEKSENKEVRYTSMPLSTYQYRIQINDRFINNVISAKKQVIISNQEVLSV